MEDRVSVILRFRPNSGGNGIEWLPMQSPLNECLTVCRVGIRAEKTDYFRNMSYRERKGDPIVIEYIAMSTRISRVFAIQSIH